MKDWEVNYARNWANRGNVRFMRPTPREASPGFKPDKTDWDAMVFWAAMAGWVFVVVLLVYEFLTR